jgi:ferrochelatase
MSRVAAAAAGASTVRVAIGELPAKYNLVDLPSGSMAPFEAVLLIAFGGPQGSADVRPFLENVLRGRRVPPERIEEVAHHYELFGGVSPITELTRRQAEGLQQRLRASGLGLPVYIGMRNWRPFLQDTLADMSRAGIRRAIGFTAAAHRSYSSCTQYRENVAAAREAIRAAGLADVEITHVPDWHTHHGFIAANADNICKALAKLPAALRDRARLVFTAHSIPVTMAERYPYREQLEDSVRLVMGHLRRDSGLDRGWATVYQSRSGRPEDPWLEPDICDYLRAEAARGLAAAVLCPIGFVCDHIEVLYDLDTEAADVCREVGLSMVRAEAVNDHPLFLDMMTDVVSRTYRQYARGRALQLVAP